ncbi:DNA repair XRCC3 [Cryptosporidium sp. chipmunk genotype I]|uniref:DNA repair XRCC3 n=1 Tax=Cryptosporidium sp. chipmunk genotype I TaxID=1280935 RepID=UPI00351A1E2B|nr:DNA repair XRCC3 [Cryptosporidium sp. chipmunk genotype I]
MKKVLGKVGGFELTWWRSRGAEEIVSSSEQMLMDDTRLSTGSDIVDKAFNGGIPKRILFEITGEAGTGKTQWCLTLITSVLLRNVDFTKVGELNNDIGIVCVIYTENGVFSNGRLAEILKSKLEFEYLRANSKDRLDGDEDISLDILSEKLMNFVKIYKISTLEDFNVFLQRVIPGICLNHKIDAIFIDSITNVYRSKVSFSENSSASTSLIQFSNIFKRISVDQDSWLIVTNQTTTEINELQIPGSNVVGNNQKPSLGLVWSNSINWRIFLSKRVSPCLGENQNIPYRELRVELSSEIPKIK